MQTPNAEWHPIAFLPNLSGQSTIEGGIIALAPIDDQRIVAIAASHPVFAELLKRFSTAFKEPLNPMTIIVQPHVADRLRMTNAVQGFRDILALSVVPELSPIFGDGLMGQAAANLA